MFIAQYAAQAEYAELAIFSRLYRKIETLGHMSLAEGSLHRNVQNQHTEKGGQAEFQYANPNSEPEDFFSGAA